MDISVKRTDRWIENNKAFRVKTIETLECDESGALFPHWILGEFSEITGDIYMAGGRDYMWFVERGQVWFIVRMSMRVFRMPRSLEEVVISYWYRDTDGKSLFNDYEIRSVDGELLVAGTSVHRPYDINECHVIPVSEIAEGTIGTADDKAPAPECRRITVGEDTAPLGERKIYYSDIDGNHHVNNSIYTRIAEDFLPEEFRERELDEYFVNFVAPTKLGETLEISGERTDCGYIIVGSCGGSVRFSSEFVFKYS